MKAMKINKKAMVGFTLIELIVTVSIVTILASIAVPSFSKLIQSNQLSAGTNELVSALILARSEALKRSNNVSVCASSNQISCSGVDFSEGWIVFVDCNPVPNGTIDGGTDCNGDGDTSDPEDNDPVIRVHDAVHGMSITKTGAGSFQTFNFTGRAPTSTITVSNSSHNKLITVSLTGRVSVTDN